MKRPVKIGLVGTGEIGQVHAQAHAATEGTELCLAALVQPEAEQRFSEQYTARLYPSFDTLLEDATVDAVDICLPNDLHRQFAVRALQAGKHVLCEKPIALTLDDADAMLDAARRADRFLMIGHVLRFWPEYRTAKEALDAGAVGQPLAISARRMVSLLHDAATELHLAMLRLKDNPGVASEHASRAKALENRVERVYREALADLFSGPEDVQQVMKMLKLREIYRHLSNCADRGDEAANIIHDIVVKTT